MYLKIQEIIIVFLKFNAAERKSNKQGEYKNYLYMMHAYKLAKILQVAILS